MTEWVDCHVHSDISWDGSFSPARFCERALELGLAGLVFTEHLELDPHGRGYARYDYDRARREVDALRSRYGDRLYLGMGLEVSYRQDLEGDIARFLTGKTWDMIMVSVHEVMGIDCSDPDRAHELWEGDVEPTALLSTYLSEVQAAVETGWFDIVGHLDVFLRLGRQRWMEAAGEEGIQEGIRRCLGIVAATPMALEVNTSGYRFSDPLLPACPHPAPYALAWFRRLGGEKVTLGSDAHRPEHLAWCFQEAARLVREAGFPFITYYRDRRGAEIAL
ncbi:MAG TPA: histidinol-phosphatase HisJ family protein [Firmicutes bacterium]|nr:histidinol-phosphatase HisJ family protein [Bacillota bacterium]